MSQHVIRVWERRYGAVTPRRTETNRRMYTESDIARLKLLQEAIKLGHSIGNIARMPEEALYELLRHGQHEPPPGMRPAPDFASKSVSVKPEQTCAPEQSLKQCKAAVSALDGAALDAALMRAHRGLSLPALIDAVVTPLLVWAGDSWKAGTLRIAHEHFVSNGMRHFLATIRNAYPTSPGAPVIVLTTPQGCLHELGAMIAAIVAAAEGWQDIYLGPNLPIEEIANTVEITQARALGLSLIYPHHNANLQVEMTTLVKYVDPNIPIIMGGQATHPHQKLLDSLGIHVIDDIPAFREFLTHIVQGRVGARAVAG